MSDSASTTQRHWAVTVVVVCLAQFMVILDATITNVALPSIQADLHFSPADLQWVVNVYLLVFGGFLLLGGRAGDLFGRRRMFLLGILTFSAASLIGGVAQSQAMLVGARALQGVGGAIVAPATLAILATTFTEGRERTRAFAAWGAVSGAGGSAGAIAGGVLTDLLDWRWILFVNVPIGAALIWRARRDLPRDVAAAQVRGRDLDVAGALTATLGLVAIVFGIVRTEAIGWGAPATLGALGVGVALLLVFLLIETRVARAPLVPLGIFRSRQLRAANVGMLLLSASLFALWYFLSLFFREVLGYSAIEAGLAFLPLTGGFALGSTQAAKVVARLGLRPTLTAGFTLSAIGIWWFSRMGVHATYVRDVLAPSIVVALGMGTAMVPLTSAGVAGVAAHETGLASGLVNVQRQVGGALGLAILATLAAGRTNDVLAAAARAGSGGGSLLARTALADGYSRAFEISAAFGLLGAIAVLLLMPRTTVAQAERVESVAVAHPLGD